MEDNRREFLKTLGKLGVALGITTAACSSKHHHHPPHHPHPHHPKHARKAGNGTAPKAKKQIKFAGNVTTTNRKSFFDYDLKPNTMMDVGEATAEAQKAIDAITNLRLDNIIQTMNPEMMVVPSHIYDFMREKEAIRNLDPYNWGDVFDLKWHDFKAEDPTHAMVTGRWVAKVRPQFCRVFDGKVEYYQSQSITMAYLVSVAQDSDQLKEIAKDQCYRQLINQLQDVILERIKRDVKQNT